MASLSAARSSSASCKLALFQSGSPAADTLRGRAAVVSASQPPAPQLRLHAFKRKCVCGLRPVPATQQYIRYRNIKSATEFSPRSVERIPKVRGSPSRPAILLRETIQPFQQQDRQRCVRLAASTGEAGESSGEFDITRLESYTELCPGEVVAVRAEVDGEDDEVIIFKVHKMIVPSIERHKQAFHAAYLMLMTLSLGALDWGGYL
jgi:hypothetical protein